MMDPTVCVTLHMFHAFWGGVTLPTYSIAGRGKRTAWNNYIVLENYCTSAHAINIGATTSINFATFMQRNMGNMPAWK